MEGGATPGLSEVLVRETLQEKCTFSVCRTLGVASEKLNCNGSLLGTIFHGNFSQKEKFKKKFSFRHTSLQFFMWKNGHMEQTASKAQENSRQPNPNKIN